MARDIKRLIFTLFMIAAIAVPVHRALSYYGLNDLTIEVGLDADAYNALCKTQQILDGIKKIKEGYLKQIIFDTLREFKDNAIAFAAHTALCGIEKSVGLPFGIGSVTIKTPECQWSIGGFTSAIIKRQVLDRIDRDFRARCTARGMVTKMGDDIRRIIQENGPDGGPAYVTDWVALQENEDARAVDRFNAILVNTDICPYFRDRVYDRFGVPRSYIENPPPLTGLGARVDGNDPFISKATCTLPDDFTPEQFGYDYTGAGGFAVVQAMLEPQNNFDGFVAMAEAELDSQRSAAVEGALSEAIAGGGFRSTAGCAAYDPNGKCLALTVNQPAGGVRDANNAVLQSEFNWVTNSDQMNELLGDVRVRVISMLLDIQGKALDFDIELDPVVQEYADIANGLRQPDDNALPGGPGVPPPGGGVDPNDPTCTGGNPDCICVRGTPEVEELRQQVANATRDAISERPDLVTSDGASVLPGKNLEFLTAVCDTALGQALGCHVNPGSDDEVVIDSGNVNISLDIITSSGVIRIPGQAIAACRVGVQ